MVRLALIFAMLAGAAQAELSNAARWLSGEAVAEGCMSGQGAFGPKGLIERDLNGDGRDDLILNHEHLACQGEGPSRSMFCGAQACSVYFYIRDDAGLLTLNDEVLGGGVSISDGTPPTIKGYAHGGAAWAIRWQQGSFQSVN